MEGPDQPGVAPVGAHDPQVGGVPVALRLVARPGATRRPATTGWGFPRRGRPGSSRRRRSRMHAMRPSRVDRPKRRCAHHRATTQAAQSHKTAPELASGDELAFIAIPRANQHERSRDLAAALGRRLVRDAFPFDRRERRAVRRPNRRPEPAGRVVEHSRDGGAVDRNDIEVVVVFGGGRLSCSDAWLQGRQAATTSADSSEAQIPQPRMAAPSGSESATCPVPSMSATAIPSEIPARLPCRAPGPRRYGSRRLGRPPVRAAIHRTRRASLPKRRGRSQQMKVRSRPAAVRRVEVIVSWPNSSVIRTCSRSGAHWSRRCLAEQSSAAVPRSVCTPVPASRLNRSRAPPAEAARCRRLMRTVDEDQAAAERSPSGLAVASAWGGRIGFLRRLIRWLGQRCRPDIGPSHEQAEADQRDDNQCRRDGIRCISVHVGELQPPRSRATLGRCIDLGEGGVQVLNRETLVAEICPGPQLVVEVDPARHADRPPVRTGRRSASMAERMACLA